MNLTRPLQRQVGFTLMEMVISLVILGLLSVVMVPLLSLPMNAYMDAQRRVELQAQLELIRSKMTDDLQYALPGSLRVRQVGAAYYLEYLEVHAVGRYRAGPDTPATNFCPPAPGCAAGDALGTSCPQEACFTTMGALNLTPGTTVTPNVDYVAIVPANAAPYLASLSRLTGRSNVVNGERLLFQAKNFAAGGASKRVYIVSPVTYECNPAASLLTRYWGYSATVFQPSVPAAGAASAQLSNVISNTPLNCHMDVFTDPTLTMPTAKLKQIVSLSLTLARSTTGQPAESVEGFIQVGIREP